MSAVKSDFGGLIGVLLVLIASALCASGASAYWFADHVVSYNPGPGYWVTLPQFNDPARCLGAPRGLYVDEPDNTSLASLGDGGSITLAFSEDVVDDPANPYGLDFIVFGNAMFVGGNPYYRFQELAYVEISQNGSDWYLILPSILPADLVGGVDTGQSSTIVGGYAEYTPTVGLPQDLILPSFPVSRAPEELYAVPERPSVPGDPSTIGFDYVSGGGDAFDIARAVVQVSPGVPAVDQNGAFVPANVDRFRFVRITDAVVGDSIPGLYEISAEIDAVARVKPAVTIGEAARLNSGEHVLFVGAVVTAVFDDAFFIQSQDRSAAARVASDRPVEPGDVLTMTGYTSVSDSGFALLEPMFTVTAKLSVPSPLGTPVRSLGSGLAYGLLVRTWGRVVDAGDGYLITISDGEHSAGAVSPDGIFVPEGSYVAVTGICDREVNGKPLIRVVEYSHIQ